MDSLRLIPHFPQYLVSDDGGIFSIARQRLMRPGVDKRGYCRQPLIRGLKGSKYVVCCYVHRLVAVAFLPPAPDNTEVDHIDGNPRNNAASNLRWVTHRENMHAAFARHGKHWMKGVSRPEKMSPIIAIDPAGTKTPFPSLMAAVAWLSAKQIAAGGLAMTYAQASGNICHAAAPTQKRTAYGFTWVRPSQRAEVSV